MKKSLEYVFTTCNECRAMCLRTLRSGKLADAKLTSMLAECERLCQTTADMAARKPSERFAKAAEACAKQCDDCAQACEESRAGDLKECASLLRDCAAVCRSSLSSVAA